MVILGLGSNIGDRLSNLEHAVDLLDEYILAGIQTSAIYESPALMLPNSPNEWDMPFLNMAVCGETHLTPEELLVKLKIIEKKVGRLSRGEWAPREIDIDILAYEDVVIEESHINVPHERLLERNFALVPFVDLVPNWRYPKEGYFKGKTAYELLGLLPENSLLLTKTNFSIKVSAKKTAVA